MEQISALFVKSGGTGSWYEIKDAAARNDVSSLSSQVILSTQLSFGLVPSGTSIDLSAKGGLVGSVQLSDLELGTTVTLYDEINDQTVEPKDLSILKLTRQTYDDLSSQGKLLSNYLYIVDCEVPTDLGEFTNSPGYLRIQNLSGYYPKTETSSGTQIEAAISDFLSPPDVKISYVPAQGKIVLSSGNITSDVSPSAFSLSSAELCGTILRLSRPEAPGLSSLSVQLSSLDVGARITLYDELNGQSVQPSDLSILKLTRETYD